MFTGLVVSGGKVAKIKQFEKSAKLAIDCTTLDVEPPLMLGESIAVNGVCLTVTEIDDNVFSADVSHETLIKTSLSTLTEGSLVNLERSLKPTSLMGGHLVTGHVDTTATIVTLATDGDNTDFVIKVPEAYCRYIAPKGSLCVDGISLTVVSVSNCEVSFAIIPHTLHHTNLQQLQQGDRVNIEVDIIARYCEKMLVYSSHFNQELSHA